MRRLVVSRRQVLRGSTGFALGLPFLPSLVPGRALGVEVVPAVAPRFIAITNMHGGVRESAMYPPEALAAEGMSYGGHTVHRGTLSLQDGGLSTVLRAPELTPRLVSKMNVLRGLDIPFYIAHNTGGMLGNYARNDGNGGDGKAVQPFRMPTIDQVMAWSPSFYRSLSGIKERFMVVDFIHARVSWSFSNPAARSGDIIGIRNINGARELFNKIFVPPATATSPAAPVRPPLINRVMENYRSLRQSNRRLSVVDRRRLDDHVGLLDELDRKFRVSPPPNGNSANCKDAKAPGSDGSGTSRYTLLNDVIATAFLCGTSRIAVVGANESNLVSFSGSWHQDHAHKWNGSGQAKMQEANQKVFQHVFLDLVRKLDVEEAPGQTVLDNSLVIWSNESAEATHDNRSMPVFTAGAAGGFLKTGNYCDYRKRGGAGPRGLLYSQFLATCLQAVGVPRAEFQAIKHNGAAGYGYPMVKGPYSSEVVQNASEILPFLKA